MPLLLQNSRSLKRRRSAGDVVVDIELVMDIADTTNSDMSILPSHSEVCATGTLKNFLGGCCCCNLLAPPAVMPVGSPPYNAKFVAGTCVNGCVVATTLCTC